MCHRPDTISRMGELQAWLVPALLALSVALLLWLLLKRPDDGPLKALGETAVFRQRAPRKLTRGIIARAADLYQANHGDADGKVRATFELITLTGWGRHRDYVCRSARCTRSRYEV